jgi:hypothetical protein
MARADNQVEGRPASTDQAVMMNLPQQMTGGNLPQQMTGDSVTIRYARDEDADAWDAFVLAAPDGSFFHRFGWRSIFRDVFRLNPRYLVAEGGGKIAGMLPIVHQKSLFFGNALIAAPFCVEGGPLAVDVRTRALLDEAAIVLMHALRAQSLEFRSPSASRTGWAVRKDLYTPRLYATFARPFSSDEEENLRAIPRKQRAVVCQLDSAVISTTMSISFFGSIRKAL